MTVARLVNLFSSFGFVPIDVQEVSDQIVEWGYYNEIIISPFDGPVGHLRGNIIVWEDTHVYGGTTEHCVVRYNQNSPLEWQRLICVKELIHSLDPKKMRINTRAKAERLLNDFSLTGDISVGMGMPALFEEVATYQALGVICPDAAVQRLVANGASVTDISLKLDIPEIYVDDISAPEWPSTRDRFVAFL